jgi:hypothetical protein
MKNKIIGSLTLGVIAMVLAMTATAQQASPWYQACAEKISPDWLFNEPDVPPTLMCKIFAKGMCDMNEHNAESFCKQYLHRRDGAGELYLGYILDIHQTKPRVTEPSDSDRAIDLEESETSEERVCQEFAEVAAEQDIEKYLRKNSAGECEVISWIVDARDKTGNLLVNDEGRQVRACEWRVDCKFHPITTKEKIVDEQVGGYGNDATDNERADGGIPIRPK